MKMKHVYLVGLSIALAACGAPDTPPQATTPVAMAGAIAISEPRVRIPASGRDQTAAYLTLTNQSNQAEALVSASSLDADKLELHAHIKASDGMMSMREIKSIEVPARATIPLTPGGLHIMVKGVKPGLKTGDKIPVELTFRSGAKVRFDAPIIENPSSSVPQKKGQSEGHQH